LRGAVLNVSINLNSIKDDAFVNEHRTRIAKLVTTAEKLKGETLDAVEGRA
jgi:formiminotetrahydrofolate cyclodeaminase